MDILSPLSPQEIIHELILPNGFFPNNSRYPLLVYKKAFKFSKPDPQDIQNFLTKNHWINSWVDTIYDYHHYHSNTHETLIIIEGHCQVQIGGGKGKAFELSQGDVIIFPAGVSHKNINSSDDFKCIGSYPTSKEYDMKYGKADELPLAISTIAQEGLPKTDPIFGINGFLFDYWK